MLRNRLIVAGLTGMLSAGAATMTTAATVWTAASAGTSGGKATSLAAPTGLSISRGACNGGNNAYKATIAWTNSTSTFASSTYNVKVATTSGGPYTSSWGSGSGTSPLASSNNQFSPNMNYYVIVQAKAGSSWVTSSAQKAMTFTCP